ncbi:hypothetical protein WJX73_000432 [Symbiochloris irregularis]|uniref:Uncharacterized protein n=1 Tax=Symbiochloris irregularis TaxID=706552 RepID=A0AAW1NTA7_9CHLO
MELSTPAGPESFCGPFAAAVAKATVPGDVAATAQRLFPAAEALSLFLPVPATRAQVYVEIGNLMQPGFKNLTLQRASRLNVCDQQLLSSGGASKADLSYALASPVQGVMELAGVNLIASLSTADFAAAEATHTQLAKLACCLAGCFSPTAKSIQDAAACFDRGLEAGFHVWYKQEMSKLDWFSLLPLVYGFIAMLFGQWYTLRNELPLAWPLIFMPPAMFAYLYFVGDRSTYLKYRSYIKMYGMLHVSVNHALLLVPAMMQPQYHDQLLAERWTSFTRMYPVSFHVLAPLLNQVRMPLMVPRQVIIVVLPILLLPRTLELTLPDYSLAGAIALSMFFIVIGFTVPVAMMNLVERTLRKNFLKTRAARTGLDTGPGLLQTSRASAVVR